MRQNFSVEVTTMNCISRRFAKILFLALLFLPSLLYSQQIIINELFNSSLSTDEWMELVIVQDGGVDLRGWDIRDFSSSGAAQVELTFSTSALWSSVPKGTIIVIGQSGATFTEDTDPSDYLLMIKGTNGIYFSGATVFLFAGASEAVQIRDASDTHVFGVSWGAANAASIPSPKVHFTAASTSNTSTFFNGNSLAGLTSTGNWTQNSASPTRGAGNGGLNSAWITSLRGNTTGDGSGSASIDPDTTNHGVISDYNITYRRDTAFTVTDMRLILPSAFSWSHNAGDVSFTNMTATASVSGDTVYLTGLSMSADSTVITVQDITAPDTTGSYIIRFQTKASVTYANIGQSPQVVVFGIPLTIAEIKANDANGIPLKLGQLVTVRAVVTVANQFGGPSYIQDNTGGMGIFGSSFSTAVNIGDEVIVSGKVDPFNGLFEITSPILHSIASTGNDVIVPVVTCAQLFGDGVGGVEEYEGRLVRVNAVTVADTFGTPIANWTVSGAGTNYRLFDASGHVDVRVDNGVDFANTPSPQSAFDIIGVMSQFKTTSPYIGGYQLMPRYAADILANGPIIASSPVESNLTQSSFRITWTTLNNGTTRLRYGLSSAYELGVLAPDDILKTNHQVDVTGLQAATIYHVQAFSVASGDTSFAADLVVSTTSPSASTGEINVYFNKSVNQSVASGELALGNQDLVSRIVSRINSSRRSIDVCLYSLSGSGEGDIIASALVAAKNRGVKVRVVNEYDNRNSAAFTTLSSNGITVINDRYDVVWDGQGLMHNKFFIIDYRGGAAESVWVTSGSWNPTDPGTNSDRQNFMEIQDVALAGAYTAEFNEMWGSTTDTPNQSNSRFGARKTNNVPHSFVIAGIPFNLYFSPSDQTTSRIRATLGKAQTSVSAALLTMTRKDLADSIISKKNAGRKARVVLDNNTDTNNQFAYLQSNGIDVRLKGGSGLLHHKYALIDAEQTGGTPYLITGSHNWSNSAENYNDENTLIIQDQQLANLYLQEFAARYYEAGGTDSIVISGSPSFSLSASSIQFDSVSVGQSKTDSVTITNNGTSALNVSLAASSNPRFGVTPTSAVIPVSSSQKFMITFTPLTDGSLNAGITFTHNAFGSPDTVSVSGIGKVPDGMIAVAVSYLGKWNMVSLPVDGSNYLSGSFIPPPVYGFNGGYSADTVIMNGKGYWVRFPKDTTLVVVGGALNIDTINVIDGWNMIGTISYPVPTVSVIPIGTTVSSNYFSYNANTGYVIDDSLQPGSGYWVKVNGVAGGLILSSSGNVQPKAGLSSTFPNMNYVRFSDEDGFSQTLYLDEKPADDFNSDFYELPPPMPQGVFDARFVSGKMVETVENKLDKAVQYDIAVRSRFSSIKIEWHIDSQERNSYTLNTGTSTNTSGLRLSGDGESTVSLASGKRISVTVSPEQVVPKEIALFQNYPNPFNPATTISFALPSDATVTLKVFNVLGEVVATLLDKSEQSGGYHNIRFDASDLSSGIYYYQLQASGAELPSAQFNQTRKLILIK